MMPAGTAARARTGSVLCSVLLLACGLTAGAAEPPNPKNRDPEYRKLVIGTWRDHYQGTRTMTVREDGTATMLVELSGVKAFLYASRLEFDMKWEIKDGRLKKQSIGGRPSGKVKLILSTMGDRVDEPILELTQDRLLLLDKDQKTKYDWRRLKPAPKDTP